MDEAKYEKKIPWYFSVWFIIVLYLTTWWLLCIPAIIMNILRVVKYDKKKVPSVILGAVGILIIFMPLYRINLFKFNDFSWAPNLSSTYFLSIVTSSPPALAVIS